MKLRLNWGYKGSFGAKWCLSKELHLKVVAFVAWEEFLDVPK